MNDTNEEEADQFIDLLDRVHGPVRIWNSVTRLLIVANAIVFVIMALLGAGWVTVENAGIIRHYGANNAVATTGGEWWRLVTSMFLHYGLVHLAFNMWALFQMGSLLEKLMGRGLFALLYLGSGIMGGFATILWHGDAVWSAGASGAISGTFGGLIGFILHEWNRLPRAVFRPLLKTTIEFTGYNLVLGLAIPQIDLAAHVGGLLAGLVLGWLVALPVDVESRARGTAGRFALGFAVLAIAVAAGVLLSPRYA